MDAPTELEKVATDAWEVKAGLKDIYMIICMYVYIITYTCEYV